MTWWKDVKLRDPNDFERKESLRLDAGSHEIKILEEGRKITTRWRDTDTGVSRDVPKIVFDVECAGKKYAWFVAEGQTTDSLYGQLVKVAQLRLGLAGKTLRVIVAGQGKNKRYQIIEVDGQPVR